MNRQELIHVTFFAGNEYIATTRMPSLPRIGEKVQHGSSTYTVADITWILNTDSVRVDLK